MVVCLRLAPAGRAIPCEHPERRSPMQARLVRFGVIEVEGVSYEHDVIIDGGTLRRRGKKPSKPYQARFGHTPLSVEEAIPWSGRRLIIGTGDSGRLPIMDEVIAEAERRGVTLTAVPTRDACRLLGEMRKEQVFAILHVTC
jgi:hypothetical protein